MDTAELRRVFSTRIRELRKDTLNQGEFADSVGVSRGAMSYYEQEARTPDIGVLRAICAKYNISADYLLGLIPDKNHSVSDVCNKTGLTPDSVRRLSLLHWLSGKDHTYEDVREIFGIPQAEDLADMLKLTPFPNVLETLNLLIENDDGLSLLTLLGIIVLGAETDLNGKNELVIRVKSDSPNFNVEIPIADLSAALWVNIQEHAYDLKKLHEGLGLSHRAMKRNQENYDRITAMFAKEQE